MPWSEARYRISEGRKSRAIAGLSAGGALATNISLNNLDVFTQLGIFSSPIRGIDQYPDTKANPLIVNTKLDLMWIGVGKTDPLATEGLRKFNDELTKLGIKHGYAETEGAHDFAVWRWCLTQFVPQLWRN